MMNRISLSPLLCALALTGCGLGGSNLELPPERPFTTLSGQVLQMRNADIQAYAYGAQGKGERLGGTQSDDQGRFSLELQVASQPILLQVSSGQYWEPASDTLISLQDDQQLRLITPLTMGQEADGLEISLFTHLHAALTDYFQQQGQNTSDAIENANLRLIEGLQIDLNHAPNEEIEPPAKPSIGDLHPAYNVALSYLTRWANEQNGSNLHDGYYSLSLAKLLYQDASHDGRLDGVTASNDSLALGNIPLNANSYRMGLAQQLLASQDYLLAHFSLSAAELLNIAQQLIQNNAALFGGNPLQPVAQMLPQIKGLNQSDSKNSFTLTPDVLSAVPLQKVSFALGATTLGEASDPAQPALQFNSDGYLDGQYALAVTVTDLLGNQQQAQLPFAVDNVYLTLDSPLQADYLNYALRGHYFGGDALSVTVNDVPMTLNTQTQSWSGNLTLANGDNELHIVLLTGNGDVDEKFYSVTLKDAPPAITAQLHGSARRINDAQYTPLENSNLFPLLLDTNQLDLAGTLIERSSLDSAKLAFFAFRAYDTNRNGGALTVPVSVSYQYFINNVAQSNARQLYAIGDEYLIPLSSETLHQNWHKTTPQDQHHIVVTVTDAAQQQVQQRFDFRLAVLPQAVTRQQSDYNIEAGIPFETRSQLSGKLHDAMSHLMVNAGNKDLMLYLHDIANYHLDLVYEVKTSEHLVEQLLEPIWQIIEPVNGGDVGHCPSIEGQPTQEPNYIFNYSGGQFISIDKPLAQVVNTLNINTATLPASEDSIPVQLDLDGEYAKETIAGAEYQYDYLLSPNSKNAGFISGRYASIYDPKRKTSTIVECPNIHSFKQLERTSYRSVAGYPKNQLAELTQSSTGSFDSFTLQNMDTATPIIADNGWYRIPAGAHFTIVKRVRLPLFDIHNDMQVLSTDFDAFEPRYLDKSFTWTLSDTVKLTLAHDIGDPMRLAEMVQAAQEIHVINMVMELKRP